MAARSVYERALRRLRATQPDAKEDAVMLLQAWLAFEKSTCRCASLLELYCKALPSIQVGKVVGLVCACCHKGPVTIALCDSF